MFLGPAETPDMNGSQMGWPRSDTMISFMIGHSSCRHVNIGFWSKPASSNIPVQVKVALTSGIC